MGEQLVPPGLWWMQHPTLHVQPPATGFDQLLTWEQAASLHTAKDELCFAGPQLVAPSAWWQA